MLKDKLLFLLVFVPNVSLKNYEKPSHENMLVKVPSFDGRNMLFSSLWHSYKSKNYTSRFIRAQLAIAISSAGALYVTSHLRLLLSNAPCALESSNNNN